MFGYAPKVATGQKNDRSYMISYCGLGKMFDDFTRSFSQERKSLGSKKTPKPRSRPSGSSKIGRAKSEGSVRNHKDYDPYRLPDDDEELDEVGACCFPALSTLFLSLNSSQNLLKDSTTGVSQRFR